MRFRGDKRLLVVSVIVMAVMATGGYSYYRDSSDLGGMISTDIRGVADFALYLPAKLPEGFVLKREEIAYRQNILFVKLVKDDQTIFISQQKKPNSMPPISSLKGFSELPVKVGYAVSGEQEGVAAVIISTDNSLITITGDKTVAPSELALVAKRLKQIN